jgi:hypothetical protein
MEKNASQAAYEGSIPFARSRFCELGLPLMRRRRPSSGKQSCENAALQREFVTAAFGIDA